MTRAKVTKVIDGDTFRVKGGKNIRLSNVRAPELGTRGGSKAKHELSNLISKKTVTYKPVGKSYGRVVANVKVGSKLVNQAMRNKGYTKRGK